MFVKDHFILSHIADTMIRRSFIAAVFLTAITTAAVVDKEPPVFTFCPTDILVDDATEVHMRVNWKQATATDNSGVTPTITPNRQSGEEFSVPGSYEVLYTAVDRCGNEAKCSFRITLKRKTCTIYPAPKNGALTCLNIGRDSTCAVMCKIGFDFVFNPPMLYFCSAGNWNYFGIGPLESRLPWPDCSASANPSWIRMANFPFYYFHGDANDPNVIATVKNNFYSLLSSPLVPPFFCKFNSQCTLENIEAFAGVTG